jgi:glucosylceramidase
VTRVLRLAAVSFSLVVLWRVVAPSSGVLAANETVSVWMTTSDRSRLLQPQGAATFGPDTGTAQVVDVNEGTLYQPIDGFGASLTESSAVVINGMSASSRQTLLNNLFSRNGSGIGLSILRQPMGASDFAASGNYSYDNTCCDVNDFNLSRDTQAIIPILKQIRTINPNIFIKGVPWSAPGWMKTTGSMNGGKLQTQYYGAFAQYFVRWIQAYQAQGLPIWAIAPQNEPMHETTGYPTMKMEATEQAAFIKNNLGPALQSAGLGSVKIIALDHNWSLIAYPRTILQDPVANPFVAGTGWHCYSAGLPNQTTLHNEFPTKAMWHTECSDGGWVGGGTWAGNFDRGMREMAIDVIRHWAQGVMKWNLALNASNGPTNGGCTNCYGTVTVNGSTVTYNAEYYFLGHVSKFVDRGARRIQSNEVGTIKNVAFRNPNGGKVLVAYNTGTGSASFRVRWAGQSFTYTLPGRAAATFTWNTNTTVPTPTPVPTATPSGTISPAAWYQVVNQNSHKCVDDANWGTTNGSAVQQWACGTGNNQQWQFRPTSGGYYQVVSRHAPTLVWDVAGVSTADSALIQLWAYGGGNNQQWLPQSTGTGTYRFVVRHTGKCLDVSGASLADGARLQQYGCNSTPAQSYRLVAMP